MRVAIIDLGTNSVRFDVHTLAESGKTKLLHREKLMIRLGQGVFLKGRMDPAAIQRTQEALAHFQEIARRLRVRKMVAFGTSALREAEDAQTFVDEMRARTGVDIKVIPGREEARLIALGVLAHERTPAGRFALVDIGGGSTEISVARGRQIEKSESFPLGTARLQQVFLKRSPPRGGSVKQLREYVAGRLAHTLRKGRWPSCPTIVGSSGTVRALSRMLGNKTGSFSLAELSALVARMSRMNTTQLLDVPGMEPKRVDMILSGAILLEEIALALGARRVQPTEYSLRDGIIEEERRLAKSHKSSMLELHLDDLVEHARRFGGEEEHLRHLADVTTDLFRRLRPVHQLDEKWRIYLLSTILLRHCGRMISYGNSGKHSHYIVKHLDFPSMDAWEHEFIADLCLFLPRGKVDAKDLNRVSKERGRRQAFLKLLALARVIDALDPGPRGRLRVGRVRVRAGSVGVAFSGSHAGLEQMLVERKKKLFESVFHRALEIERHRG